MTILDLVILGGKGLERCPGDYYGDLKRNYMLGGLVLLCRVTGVDYGELGIK